MTSLACARLTRLALLPQANWPEDHAPKVESLLDTLADRPDLTVCRMAWSSGLIVATKRA